jgi:hypothetical protein
MHGEETNYNRNKVNNQHPMNKQTICTLLHKDANSIIMQKSYLPTDRERNVLQNNRAVLAVKQ